MFITTLVIIQTIFFCIVFCVEKVAPENTTRTPQCGFKSVLCVCLSFGAMFAQVLFFTWTNIGGMGFKIAYPPLLEGAFFYLIYSFTNYWAHRVKHSFGPFWTYLHRMHHAPEHMDSRVAFYRHPLEMVANAVVLFVLGKCIFDVSAEAVAMALVIEGMLETFHHANIKLPNWVRPLGYVVQIPEQHLVHHENGVHRYNYSPLTLWDAIFRTLRFQPSANELGFKRPRNAWHYLGFKS